MRDGRTAVSTRTRFAMFAVLALVLTAVLAASAAAKSGGQLESWGAFGTGNGQFNTPFMLGADSTDGTVYAGDIVNSKNSYRIQQLSSSGTYQASVQIPRFAGANIIVGLHGIAVDPALDRIYVVESCKVTATLLTCKATGQLYGAKQIRVYSTNPVSGALVPDPTTPTIALPSGADELYFPQSIAVDPATHDVVLLAEDQSNRPVIQRFSSSGAAGARFVDSEKKLRPAAATRPVSSRDATSIAVGPTGVTYTMTGNSLVNGGARAWQLPADLSKVEPVPGFAAAAEAEAWEAPMISSFDEQSGSTQLAVSPDGATLFWKEKVLGSEPTEAGSMLIRGFSLAGSKTSSLWGNGSSSCKVTTNTAGLAAGASGKLVVFDFGPTAEPPAYGNKVVTFGAAGTGCPEPKAKFTVNGKSEAETPTGINPGDTVSFNANVSELLGGFRKELIWKFGDGQEKVVKYTPGTETEADKEAVTTVTHQYASAAKVTVRLEIRLSGTPLGSPDPVERTFNVGNPASTFKLKVNKGGSGAGTVTSTPAGINCGSACEAEFNSGAAVTLAGTPDSNSKAVVWSGCGELVNGNDCKVTMSAAKEVTASFDLSGGGGSGLYCNGVAISGSGTGLQSGAHAIWAPAFSTETCPGGAAVSYNAGPGISAWEGTVDTSVAFIGTDAAPTPAQIASVKAAAGPGVRLAVIPVAQTSVAIVANLPAGCTVEEVTSSNLAALFEGRLRVWSDLATAEGSCASPIVRVVPKDAQAVTTQLKNYLSLLNKKALACAPGNATWEQLEASNTVWPESCPAKALSAVVRPAADGGLEAVAKVNATSGAVGFATLADARAGSAKSTLAIQNNGFASAAEATFAFPGAGAQANCGSMTYKTPVGGGGLDLDWTQVFGARPAIGEGAYPLCMLTYVLAFHGYEAAGFSVEQERTVKDYLNGYVVKAGQAAIATASFSPLPSSGAPRSDVLGEARKAAAKIIR